MIFLPVPPSYVSYPLLVASGKGFNRTPHASSSGPFTVTKPQWVEEGSSYESSVWSPDRQLSQETGSRVGLEQTTQSCHEGAPAESGCRPKVQAGVP